MQVTPSARDVLVVAPHPDDAAYSASAVLAEHPHATVLTVLAGAPSPPVVRSWDQQCGFRDSDHAVEARRQEDDAAFAGTQHALRRLPLLEAPYLTGPRTAQDAAVLDAELEAWLSAAHEPLVCMPAGAGVPFRTIPAPPPGRRWTRVVKRIVGAPGKKLFDAARRRHRDLTVGSARTVNGDHLWVRDTVLDHLEHLIRATPEAPGRTVEVEFYEDYPYLLSQDATGAVEELSARLGPLDERVRAVDTAVKRALMEHYRSQLVGDSSIVDDGVLPPSERSWTVRLP